MALLKWIYHSNFTKYLKYESKKGRACDYMVQNFSPNEKIFPEFIKVDVMAYLTIGEPYMEGYLVFRKNVLTDTVRQLSIEPLYQRIWVT